MFAEDAGILPKNLIERLASATKGDATAFSAALHDLFGKMAKSGWLFGVERIEWFNGGLFDDAEVIELAPSGAARAGRGGAGRGSPAACLRRARRVRQSLVR